MRWQQAADIPLVPWGDIPRSKKRLIVDCNHGSSDSSAPRREVGGLTSDRVHDLAGADRFLDDTTEPMSLRCPVCKRVWEVPMDSLQQVARDRGHKLLRKLVHELPGVSLQRGAAGSG